MQLKFTINWQIQLSRNLRLTAVNIANLRPFIVETLNIIHDRSNELFNSAWRNVEKNPIWAPLSEKTIRYKKRKYNSTRPLINTWRLKNDVSKIAGQKKWTLLYRAPYAIYHQSWWPHLPRRAIIDLSNSTNDKIIKALQKKINNDLRIFWKQV